MRLPKVDYHMHTPLCGHAVGDPSAYVEQALKVGLSEVGFSDHAPLVAYANPKYAMGDDQLPLYHRMMEDLRARYPKFTVKVGLEADYIPGFEEKTRAILAGYPYDFVIGSIHFIDNWAFDDPDEHVKWRDKDIDRVYRDYYELLRRSAASGLFDIIGHCDLVKKFGHRAHADLTPEIERTAEAFRGAGVTVEINTSGLRKPVKEIYPSLEVLKIYRRAGVPITFSSDSHDPADVGRDYDKAADLARAAGYAEYRVFRARKTERTEPL
ncbi:MAG TPA: histidinol-phosphatase HisJ family protein [Candidatus Eisenbacteria bacterium]|nr:histidinol-phosphatase HisJ family protein [Candidatus Eisenbacteria bacterium]